MCARRYLASPYSSSHSHGGLSRAEEAFIGRGSETSRKRLLKDLKELQKSHGKFGVSGGPRGDNLFIWDAELRDFQQHANLHRDLMNYASRYGRDPVVQLEIKFPQDYPSSPPFIRVIRPRFRFLTGHITIGGSVCMQMLTRSAWRSTNYVEGILVAIRAEIMSDANTRLDYNPDNPYNESEARRAFDRMVMRYGWG